MIRYMCASYKDPKISHGKTSEASDGFYADPGSSSKVINDMVKGHCSQWQRKQWLSVIMGASLVALLSTPSLISPRLFPFTSVPSPRPPRSDSVWALCSFLEVFHSWHCFLHVDGSHLNNYWTIWLIHYLFFIQLILCSKWTKNIDIDL